MKSDVSEKLRPLVLIKFVDVNGNVMYKAPSFDLDNNKFKGGFQISEVREVR